MSQPQSNLDAILDGVTAPSATPPAAAPTRRRASHRNDLDAILDTHVAPTRAPSAVKASDSEGLFTEAKRRAVEGARQDRKSTRLNSSHT